MVAIVAQLTLEAGVQMLGIARTAGEILHLLVWGAVTMLSAGVQRSHWISVAVFFAWFLVAARWPDRRWDMMSASLFVVCCISALGAINAGRKPADKSTNRVS